VSRNRRPRNHPLNHRRGVAPGVPASLLLVLVVLGAVPAAHASPVKSGNQQFPTDDSLWIVQDSIVIGPPIDSIWRGLCLDPNGIDSWITQGDRSTDVRKRHLITGSTVLSQSGHCPGPFGIVRFDDSLCISSHYSNHFDVYDTMGVHARTITSPLPGLRGVDWDGTNFWATSADSQQVFVMSRTGELLRILRLQGAPSLDIGTISLDRTCPGRFWLSSVTTLSDNIGYCSFDTTAGEYAVRAAFTQHCVGYPGGIAFDGPRTEGSFVYVVDCLGPWLWRVKVHEPMTGIARDEGRPPAEAATRLQVTPNPSTSTAVISWVLPRSGSISLKLYDVTGKIIAALDKGHHPAGRYSSPLTANSLQPKLASGIYLLELEACGLKLNRKLTIE